jgi:hypothetical protein
MLASRGSHPETSACLNSKLNRRPANRRGYFKATVTPQQMRLDLRFVTSVEDPGGTGYPAGSWLVHDGIPGAVPA